MNLPADSPVTASSAPEPDIGWAGTVTLAFVLLYTLTLAAGGGYVFYASIRPVTLATGLGAGFELPWILAYFALLAAWLVGAATLLVIGLIHLLPASRRKWWLVMAWVGTLAAGTAIGYVIHHDYLLLFRSYPVCTDGSGDACGSSRWAPGAPYWQAVVATLGQLAVGVVMTAVITAPARRKPRQQSPGQQLTMPDLYL
jgi:hypothetical protein